MANAKRSAAGKKAAATRAKNKAFAKRSVAARKGWSTRRQHQAQDSLQSVLGKPGGKNTRRGVPRPYGYYDMERYDFRGMDKAKQIRMLRSLEREAPGHYARVLVASTSDTFMRGLYPGSVPHRYTTNHKPGRPYYFWTSETLIEDSDQLYSLVSNIWKPGEVFVLAVDVL